MKTPFQLENYIDGELCAPASSAYLDNIDPSTGQIYSHIPRSSEVDVQAAYRAAKNAFPEWANTPIEERSRIMLRISELIEKQADELAEAESLDNGKPIWLAKQVDIPRAASNMRFFATAIVHQAAQAHSMGDTVLNYTLRKPLGVVACISPWNLPLYLFTWKIAPALAAGNTVIAKPSEVTPYTAYLFSKICQEAGLPKGVLNIIHGTGPEVGEALVQHPQIKAVSFTGGTTTGKRIASILSTRFVKSSLELGGKNPNIIFDDADFDQALKTTLRSSFANQGQICLCGSRVLVQKRIYVRFRDALVERTNEMVVGPPSQEGVDMGALVSASHLEKVMSYVDLAKEEGGTVLTGGTRVELDGEHRDGFYMRPTIIEGLPMDCRTNQEEIFGPVITIMPFEDEADAILLANASEYGLAASIWTNNLKRAHRMAAQVEAGIIWVNTWLLRDLRTPFGGMKQSGMGREGGYYALDFFTEPKNVCIRF